MDIKIKFVCISKMIKFTLFFALLFPSCSLAQELTLSNVERKGAGSTWGEQIAYNWTDSKGSQVIVVFRQRRLDNNWIAKIELSNNERKNNFASAQLSSIFASSWVYFESEKPGSSLVSVGFDVSMCSNIWKDMQERLIEKLPLLNCCATFKSKELAEIFSAIFSSSKGLEDFAEIISRHGKEISYAGSWDMVVIDESLLGKPWSDLATAPNVGLTKPILVGLSLQAK